MKKTPNPVDIKLQDMPIAVRAYVRPHAHENQSEKRSAKQPYKKSANQSKYTLIFDCETTTDVAQDLRFGAYQFRKGDDLIEDGLFYNPARLSTHEIKILQNHAGRQGIVIREVADFIESVFYRKAYEWRAAIIGFNLPFDISRLAIGFGSARGQFMKGGFTFALSQNRYWPNIQVKHLSSYNAFIQFTKPPRRIETRSEYKKFGSRPSKRGSFIDVKTLARALLSRSFNLSSLSDFLNVKTPKKNSDEHGRRLTKEYIKYGSNDVQTTWECYLTLLDRFTTHGLKQTEANKIYSEASLGKAYLREMRIRPLAEVQPEFPDQLTSLILSTYLGGRSEVHLRRVVKQVIYLDFLSMYPTVFTLMGLWQFVIAQGVDWSDTTDATRRFIDALTLDDLQNVDTWKQLTTLVRIAPDGDILPVRAKYDGQSYTIGLNHLTSEQPLWSTLADVIASKLLDGKAPRIVEAITFRSRKPQDGLQPMQIAGEADFLIDLKAKSFSSV